MSRSITLASLLVVSAVAAACGGAAPATPLGGTTAPTTGTTGGGATAAATPAPTNPPVAVGSECAGRPTFNLASPAAAPSFANDPAIEAIFPTEVDGKPVTDVQSSAWIDSICFYGGQTAVDKAKANSTSAALLANLTTGSANANVGGHTVNLFAFRLPGQDANVIVQNVGLFVAGLTGGTPPPFTTSQTTIGGKQVYVLTGQDDTTYAYAKGDILLTISGVDATQAATVLQAVH